MKYLVNCIALSLGLMLNHALAQQTPAAGLNFKLGDDVATVKTALRTNIEPEPMENPIPSALNYNIGKTVLQLRTKGITVVFNKKGAAESIKFDEAFSGSVAGVKLGDSEKALKSAMGKPIKAPWNIGANQIFLYALDDTAYIRFDVNDSNGIQTIYIQK